MAMRKGNLKRKYGELIHELLGFELGLNGFDQMFEIFTIHDCGSYQKQNGYLKFAKLGFVL
jgi:hypothetical protein